MKQCKTCRWKNTKIYPSCKNIEDEECKNYQKKE